MSSDQDPPASAQPRPGAPREGTTSSPNPGTEELARKVADLADALRHALAAIDVVADHLDAVVPEYEDHLAQADALRRRVSS